MTECVRCGTTEDTAVRLLWHGNTYAPLCVECNAYVQGPDHLEVSGNRP